MTLVPSLRPIFDRLYDAGSAAVLDGTHQVDTPPEEGGRWPVTVVCRPPAYVREHLDGLMREALRIAGPHHFRTGREDTVHLTVRALEGYREAAAPQDPEVGEWAAAMRRAAARVQPLRLALTGLTLTRVSVMAQLEPLDESAWQLMAVLRDELGPLGSYEEGFSRDIWYANLVHFAGPVADPEALVRWVDARRRTERLSFLVDTAELVRYHYVEQNGERLVRPTTWAATRLGEGAALWVTGSAD